MIQQGAPPPMPQKRKRGIGDMLAAILDPQHNVIQQVPGGPRRAPLERYEGRPFSPLPNRAEPYAGKIFPRRDQSIDEYELRYGGNRDNIRPPIAARPDSADVLYQEGDDSWTERVPRSQLDAQDSQLRPRLRKFVRPFGGGR